MIRKTIQITFSPFSLINKIIDSDTELAGMMSNSTLSDTSNSGQLGNSEGNDLQTPLVLSDNFYSFR